MQRLTHVMYCSLAESKDLISDQWIKKWSFCCWTVPQVYQSTVGCILSPPMWVKMLAGIYSVLFSSWIRAIKSQNDMFRVNNPAVIEFLLQAPSQIQLYQPYSHCYLLTEYQNVPQQLLNLWYQNTCLVCDPGEKHKTQLELLYNWS